MKKSIRLIILLFTIVFVFVFSYGQSIKDISEKDGIIEWQGYREEWLV